MNIKKSQIDDSLKQMELSLFGKSMEDNKYTTVPRRIADVFCEAYYKNFYPPESVILKESYRLLQTKGYYYTEE